MNKAQIINEIKSYLKIGTDTEFANFLGVKQPTISTWRKRNTIDYDLIIAKCNKIDANWLLTGKGSMLKNVEKIGVNQNIIGDGSTMIGGSIYGDNPSVSKIKEYEKEIKEKDKEIKRLKNQIDTLFKMLQK
ncbi:helix-turn-helix domain-containing protein [Tenacibaculum maritimum]|uniref:helix-turn-helix domain-containing protein n=1 Tax=Tenacibaculum maritimum TaxID=107401 RepID=UPI0012E440C6|nr:helix-turn-helix domain-containing protein [Tenacibaculum maritimum]CAA0211327.1 conserved hypothetical protein [Tenacibaculum maritimum]